MSADTLAQMLQKVDNPADKFRNNDPSWQPYVFRDEFTNWIEEQRAVRESVAVVDQSYHMEILEIDGPEAIDLLERIAVNNFDRMRTEAPPQAINYLPTNPDGYVIGDVIVFYLGKGEFKAVGSEWINNWIRYHAEVLDFDVETNVPYHPYDDHEPPDFRFQVQGPNALDVIETVIDGPLPEIPFFRMDTLSIDGVSTYALSHGMAAMPGLEIFGDYEHHDQILDSILEAGADYGIRQMGRKAYKTGKIGSGWFVAAVPAIYQHEELAGYREWLPADSMEAQLSIGGSYVSDDITDYYMTPLEQGKGHLVDLDHDFIGRDALEAKIYEPHRERVTLVWDDDDVVDIYASLFRDGKTKKFVDMPDVATRWSEMHYDEVLKDGKLIGLSKYPGYLYYTREMLSLATIDPAYSDPGTRVSFVWGDTSSKRKVERHEPVEVSATVAEAPYVRGGRINR